MNREQLIGRIWDNLETLNDLMISSGAEDLTGEQLEFVHSRLSAILDEVDGWFSDEAP